MPAPVGAAPPPVAPVPADSVAPPELEPDDPVPELEDPTEAPPVDADAELLAVLVVVVVFVGVVVGGALALAPGTVSGGAPAVSVDGVPPPPQAARTPDAAMPAASHASLRAWRPLVPMPVEGLKNRAAPCAFRRSGSR